MTQNSNTGKIKRVCQNCKTEFLEWPAHIRQGKGKFCSKICAYASKKGKPKKNRTSKEIACLNCGKQKLYSLSRIASGRGKFCSKKCADIYKTGKSIPGIKRVTQNGLFTRNCLFCNATIHPNKWKIEHNLGKFCNQNCYWKSKKGKPSPKKQNIKVNCIICGVEKIVNKTRLKTFKTCSRQCLSKHAAKREISESTRMKLSAAQKGKDRPWLHTKEAIEKMRLKKLGRPSWNKGKRHSPEHLKNSSEAHMRRDFNAVLAQREFKLLSPYVNTHKKVKLQCKFGHDFENAPAHIKSGQGCGVCSTGVSERICRAFFEEMFNQKFPKVRPGWLEGMKGSPLELDGYCESLKLAFEYQGRHHFERNEFFHSKRSLEEIQKADQLKRAPCEAKGITLIEVPATVPFEKMQEYIAEQCKKHNIHPLKTDKIDYKEFDVYSIDKLKKFKEIAISKRGLCLSKEYVNNSTPLKFQCEKSMNGQRPPQVLRQELGVAYVKD